jgi:hypothetical protein
MNWKRVTEHLGKKTRQQEAPKIDHKLLSGQEASVLYRPLLPEKLERCLYSRGCGTTKVLDPNYALFLYRKKNYYRARSFQ